MNYLHTMLRVEDLDRALDFFVGKLGCVEVSRKEYPKGRFTLVFLAAPGDLERARSHGTPLIELTWNWDPERLTSGRNFGHLAFRVEDIHATCRRLMEAGVAILRPPRDGHMAFVRSPDGHSIELLQTGEPLPPEEPWISMPNRGTW